MSARELLARLTNEMPAVEPVAPVAFLDDDVLPKALAPVEPGAFTLACAQAVCGTHGRRN